MPEGTDQSRTCTEAPRVTKHLTPRPPFPDPTVLRRPLTFRFDRGAYDASYDRFQHHADRAFGDGTGGAA